ncbi:MAG: tetratricopeptide repeat protein [Candidatus Eremiobacteraeota bacterium]|nr:tetratricopeptide repeat protein [Candidatus Eremiobacteraeota bacterium]
MIFRVHTPDKKLGPDGLPVTILPDKTVLKEKYTVTYMTVGGMAVIYRAKAGEKLSIIKEVAGSDGQAVISLTSEKSLLERLDHPGIVKVEELFEEEGSFYLAMEYIEGENLLKKIPRSTKVFLSEKVVLEWTGQILDIFEYLHSQKPPIIYRDLKPQNMILEASTGKVKLIDFGIARIYKDKKSEDTEKMGTIITASPEHYGEGQTDARSDIYTIGATIYLLLTNNVVWRETLFRFPPVRDMNPKVSERTQAAVQKALQIKPQDRFQSIAEMREAFFGAKDERGEHQALRTSLLSSQNDSSVKDAEREVLTQKLIESAVKREGTASAPARKERLPVEDETTVRLRRPEAARGPGDMPRRLLRKVLLPAALLAVLLFSYGGFRLVKLIAGARQPPLPGAPSSPPPAVIIATPSKAPVPPPLPESPRAGVTEALPDAAKLMEKGILSLTEGRFTESEACFREALTHDPKCAEAYWYIGQSLEGREKGHEALRAYKEYIKRKPKNPERLRHIAGMSVASKDCSYALPLLIEAQKLNRTADGAFSIGICYYQNGDYEKAIAALRQALRLQSNHLSALLLLADCHSRKGSLGDALSAYKAAEKMKPGQISLLRQIGVTASEAGDYRTSKDYLNRYLLLERDEDKCAEARRFLEEVKIKAMKAYPPSVERQRDFLPQVSVIGIFGSGKHYTAHMLVKGDTQELREGDRFLSGYYVVSINPARVVLAKDEAYCVLKP